MQTIKKTVTFRIVRTINIGNRTFKRRERTEVCIGREIIPWIYYKLTEKSSAEASAMCLKQRVISVKFG